MKRTLYGIAFAVLILDQITKLFAASYLLQHGEIQLLPFLSLVLVHNTGAAFGFLNSAGGWQNFFFIAVALAASGFIVRISWRTAGMNTLLSVGLMLILGGAVGNLIDRLLYGYVIDFVDVYYGSWHWPAFNIADSAITVGAGLLILDVLKPQHAD